MRPIRNSAIGVGIVSGIAVYAFIYFFQQIAQPGLALDLLAALGVGLGLAVCYYVFCKLALRRIARHFRSTVAPLVGAGLPPEQPDELADLRQTYEHTVKALTRHDRYSAITDQLLSSDDIASSFRVIAEHAARSLAIDGAALFLRDGGVLHVAATWNLDGAPLPETEQESALWRALHENRPQLLSHADEILSGSGIHAAALLVAPLDVADRPVGALALVSRTDSNAFHEDDLALAHFFTGQVGLAVRQAQSSGAARTARNQLAGLCQVARELSDTLNLDDVLRHALAAATALTASSHATVLLLDDSGERIARRLALESDNIAPLDMVAGPVMGQGLAGWAVRERRAALIRDTEQDTRWLPGPGLGDMRSALAVPLLYDSRALGIITLAHDAPDHYTEDHQQLLEALGAQAALAIQNARRPGFGRWPRVEDERASAALVGDGDQRMPRATDAPAADQAAPSLPSAHDAVALFADLRGFDRAGERLEPEILIKEVLEVYLQTVSEAIQRYDGYVDKCSEDGVLAIFGHSGNLPDDAQRAVQAALAIRHAGARLRTSWRARLGVDLGVAVGIGRGRVAVGRGAPAGRYDYTVIGDAVNLAGRLQDLARPGEILAAADVIEALNGASAMFSVEALPPLPIKGLNSIQNIYRVGDPAASTGSSWPAHNQSVGSSLREV